jgi:5-methylcytosine-specific restriction enzyme A
VSCASGVCLSGLRYTATACPGLGLTQTQGRGTSWKRWADMTSRAAKACSEISCTTLVHDGGSRCVEHRKRWSDYPRTESSKVTGTRRWREETRPAVLVRDRYRCQVMGPTCTLISTEVDHIVEVSAGGAPYDPANCRAICGNCHDAVSAASRANPPPGVPPSPRPVKHRRRRRDDAPPAQPRTIFGGGTW